MQPITTLQLGYSHSESNTARELLKMAKEADDINLQN